MTHCPYRAWQPALALLAACEASPLDRHPPHVADGATEPSIDASQSDQGDDALVVDGAVPARADAALPDPSRDSGRPPGESAPGTWLRGDLHVHSHHSTDAGDSPVADVIAKAEQLGLDFLAITDHDNHVQGNLTTWADPDFRSDKLVLLYGVEWTTAKGHANIFSARAFDHPALWAIREGSGEASIAAAHAQGLHFSVNHPAAKDLWEYGFELAYDSMEVWTAVFLVPNSNDKAIERWDDVLLTGRRMTARGGSDSHHQHDAESLLFNIGNPTTWVRAREATPAAVLEALAGGHVSVSYAPRGERLDLTADADGDGSFETIVGDTLQATGEPLAFKVEIEGFRAGKSYDLTVIKNGQTLMSVTQTAATFMFSDTPNPGERAYYRLELRGETPEAPLISGLGFGRFVALTNPIYVAFP